MAGRDEGQTWKNEVYFLDSTSFAGSYSATVVFEGDTLVTIADSSVGYSWKEVGDRTDLYGIVWKLRKK